MSIPNIITTIRIILVPLFIYSLYFNQKNSLDFFIPKILFLICIISDMLDGFIARYFKTKTLTGAFLDPLADKLLILSSYFLLTYFNKLPAWLFLITIAREIIIILGWFIVHTITGIKKVKSRLSGKLMMVLQTLSVIFILFNLPSQSSIFIVTAISIIVSVFDYCIKSIKEISNFTSGNLKT